MQSMQLMLNIILRYGSISITKFSNHFGPVRETKRQNLPRKKFESLFIYYKYHLFYNLRYDINNHFFSHSPNVSLGYITYVINMIMYIVPQSLKIEQKQYNYKHVLLTWALIHCTHNIASQKRDEPNMSDCKLHSISVYEYIFINNTNSNSYELHSE